MADINERSLLRRKMPSRNTVKVTTLRRNRSVDANSSRLSLPISNVTSRSLTDLTDSTEIKNDQLTELTDYDPPDNTKAERRRQSADDIINLSPEDNVDKTIKLSKPHLAIVDESKSCGNNTFYTKSFAARPSDDIDSSRCHSIISVDSDDTDISDAELLDEKIIYDIPRSASFSASGSESESDHSSSSSEVDKARDVVTVSSSGVLSHKDVLDDGHKIVYELYTTERSYVQRLKLLKEIKEETSQLLGSKVAEQMFCGIEKICNFHSAVLLPKIEQRVLNWGLNRSIGDVMTNACSLLRLYESYIVGLDDALFSIGKYCKQNIQYANRLRTLKNKYGGTISRLSIESHMTEPMQRIPRYELLIKEYLKKIPRDCPEYHKSNAALQYVTDAAIHVNKMTDKQIKLKELIKIQDSLLGKENLNIISSERELVHRGTIQKVNATHGRPVERYAMLFSDMLILTVEEKTLKKYIVKDVISLKDITLEDGDSPDEKYMFIIITARKCWELAAKTEAEKRKWYKIISDTAKTHSGKSIRSKKPGIIHQHSIADLTVDNIGKQAPILVHFSDVSMCMRCTAKFSMFKPKHHCKACGAVVCYNCAFRTMELEYSQKEGRICDRCYMVFTQGRDRRISTGLTTVNGPELLLRRYVLLTVESGLIWKKRWITVTVKGRVSIYKANKDVMPIKEMRKYHVSLIDLSGDVVIQIRHRHQNTFIKERPGETNECYRVLSKFSCARIKPKFSERQEADVSLWNEYGSNNAKDILTLMTKTDIGQAGLTLNLPI